MLLRPELLSQALDHPLPTKDGDTLHTIGVAVEHMTSIGKKTGAADALAAGLQIDPR
jgi:hypothetical protein